MPKLFKKGQIPWNKGVKMSDEMKQRISNTLKRKGIKPKVHFSALGEKHPFWKGDRVSYSGLHYWLSRRLGKPRVCDRCGTTIAKKYEWANISGKYKRDITDWSRMCTRCHRIFDNHPWFTKIIEKL